jgi:zinc/manganese transport system ATP-binding protein
MNRRAGEVSTHAATGQRLDDVIPTATGDAAAQPPRDDEMGADREVVWLSGTAARIGGQIIWSEVSLTVRAGEFVAILGPNGVGKSTLLKAVLGLIPFTAGQARVLGARPKAGNAAIGYLPQRRAFDPGVRIRGVDIVRLGWDGDRWGVPLPALPWAHRSRAARQRVREVIALVGAQSYAHRPIGQSSGGEQQRLLIAQALVRRPELLLLDEPLDSLDVTSQASISALIQSVRRSEAVAVMLVAHDVNPILPYLDQVIYLSRRGVVMGPPEQVITADTLSMLYGTPIDVLRDHAGRLVVVGHQDLPPHQLPRPRHAP